MAQQSKKIKVFDGRYEILSVVGRGECSVVYKVKLIAPPRMDAALKVLVNRDSGGSNIDKLRKEALAMVSSRHRYVIRLDDFHSFNDICYLCMEYAPHNSMRLYTESIGGKLPIEQAETYLSQMLDALSFVHNVGIVHRDIKPDNILVVSEEEARLADFGIAVLPGEESSLEELQKGVGTMDYMAPEVFQAKSCSARSDVYCMGVTFYEMLSGVQPFNGAPLAKLLEIRRDKNITPISALVPHIPQYLADIIMRAMSFDEKDRFESGKEMLEEFNYARSKHAGELADPVIPDNVTDSVTEESDSQEPFFTNDDNDNDDVQNTFSEYEDNSTNDTDDDVIFGEETLDLHNAAKYQQVAESNNNDFDGENDETIVISQSELQESLNNTNTYSQYNEEEAFDDDATIPITQPQMFSSDHQTLGPSNAQAWQEAHEAVNEYEEDGTLMVEDLKNEEDPREGIKEHGFDFINASLNTEKEVPVPETFREPLSLEKKTTSNNLPKLVIAFVLLAIVYAIFFSGGSTSEPEQQSAIKPAEVQRQIKQIHFPNLPAGVYSGQVNNFFPGVSVPLSFISLPSEQSIAVIIGIDGWRTTKVHIDPEKASKSFKVRANGMVLVFKASSDDGLRGSFENQITHDKGSWEAYPVAH